MNENHSYELIAIKRRFVPNWLYWMFCRRIPFFGQAALIQPFRWILHTANSNGIPDEALTGLANGTEDLKQGRHRPIGEIRKELSERNR